MRLVPRFRHYLAPRYHPSQHVDPVLFANWAKQYAQGVDVRELSLAQLRSLSQQPVDNDQAPDAQLGLGA